MWNVMCCNMFCNSWINWSHLSITLSPCSHETFKSIWNRFQSDWLSCERKQKASNRFQTDLAQTYLRVGLKSVWNRFEDINRHVNALATWNRFWIKLFFIHNSCYNYQIYIIFVWINISTEKDDFRTFYRIKIEP